MWFSDILLTIIDQKSHCVLVLYQKSTCYYRYQDIWSKIWYWHPVLAFMTCLMKRYVKPETCWIFCVTMCSYSSVFSGFLSDWYSWNLLYIYAYAALGVLRWLFSSLWLNSTSYWNWSFIRRKTPNPPSPFDWQVICGSATAAAKKWNVRLVDYSLKWHF